MMQNAGIVSYICLLKDVLRPLSILSQTLQCEEMTVAQVPIELDTARLTLEAFKDRY